MGDEDRSPGSSAQPPSHVTLSPFTPIPRRLSSRFSKPSSPVRACRKNPPPLPWAGADEPTSVRAIGGGFSPLQALAWDLFSPFHRVLVVAVAAASVISSEKNRQICQLSDAVRLRDQILMSMQEKLDNLCEQVNYTKDQPQVASEASLPDKNESFCNGCWLCDQHRAQLNDLSNDSITKAASSDEVFKGRVSISNVAEQEERRMSDLSDWASSITSTADIQLNNLAIEQDIYNLKKECEEKDAALQELSSFIHSKDAAASKRIEELEDIIRRKNTIITKLKKDIVVLEQKVMNLTRLKRRSFSGASKETTKQLPMMTDNVLYDMDSSTSPSSSDSDSYSRKQNTRIATVRQEALAHTQNSLLQSENCSKRDQKSLTAKTSATLAKPSVQTPKTRSVSPLKEKSLNQRLMQKPTSVGSSSRRLLAQSGSRDPKTPQRRLS